MEFTARVENFNTKLWSYHVKVPGPIAKHFLDQGDKRVVCKLNDSLEVQCAIMPAGEGVYFINLNKKIRDQLHLKEGSKVSVHLEKDNSEFGLPFPVELDEVLAQDKVGKDYFFKLTPGKQRNIIYGVSQVKNTDLRIQRAMIMIEHLKNNKGKIDFRQLNAELKSTQ
ncbi:MAG: DUF1905 domain-containing protein [Saprospiraceae bacterium]|nr:DUF1905 domain-containing protein [Candidatus Opimibacter iunctus]